jgi:addiction module HigA family antidote
MRRRCSPTFGRLLEIGLRLSLAIGCASTASESTINGEFVFGGSKPMRLTSGLWTITRGTDMPKKTKTTHPIHPGETLREDFLKPLGLTANRLAIELRVPVTRVNDIVRGKRAITADTALRLARFFRTTPQFWMNLQANYELELAEDARGAEISERIRPHRAA